jgi:hypothetical protein
MHSILNAVEGVDFAYSKSDVPAILADIMHSFESTILKLVLSILLDPLGQSDIKDPKVEQNFGSFGTNRSGNSTVSPGLIP